MEHTRTGSSARIWLLGVAYFALLSGAWGVGPPRLEARMIRFDRLSLDDGLSQAAVNVMIQDRTGFLWLGTQDGLNRFDGIDFEVFKNDPDDPGSISNSWIEALLEDQAGDIWIATRGGGLNRWVRATGRFERFVHDPADPTSLAGNLVRALLIDRGGRLWVGTEDAGLDRFDPATGEFHHYRHDPSDAGSLGHDKVRALFEDSAGRIWIGTLGGGMDLYQADSDTFRHFRHDPTDPSSLNDDSVRAFLEDADGAFWVASHGGVARMDRDGGRFERFVHDPEQSNGLGGERVRALLSDSHGRLWIGTDSGLDLFDPETETFLHYRYDAADAESLGNDRIASLLEDRGGVLWIGTQGGGVSKWNPRDWSFANDSLSASDLGNSDVLALTLDTAGRLWLGTSGGGVDVLDRRTGAVTRHRHDPGDPQSLSDDRVTALLSDSRGVMWVGTIVGGLNRFNSASGDFTRFRHDPARSDSLGADGVMNLFEDPQKRLWVGTFGGGVNLLDRKSGTFRRWLHDPDDPASLSDSRVTSFAAGPDGTLWVGTFSGGVNWFDPETGRFIRLTNDPENPASLSNDTVMTVRLDSDGALWVGTQRGLNRLVSFDSSSGSAVFRCYLAGDGLAGDFVYGILSDDEGSLWISTNSGLTRFNPEAETYKNFDVSHGLQSDEFNMNAYYRASDGELFFGGVNGFNSFHPEKTQLNDAVPPVAFTAFTKMNQPVQLESPIFDVERIELDHRENVFSFEFAALDFTAPRKNRYRYKLEGFDENWVDHGTRRLVTFTNLDPGTYTLRIQGSNNDGVWNEEGQSIEIVIKPPFWMTWWFRILGVIVVASIVRLVFALRTRSIRRRNEQLRQVVAERTQELEDAQDQLLRRERLAVLGELAGSVAHELRNPLGVIKNSAYFLRLTQKVQDPKGKEHLEMIENEIARSNRIITEMLDFGRDPQRRVSRVVVQELAKRVALGLRLPETIKLELDFDPTSLVVEADEGQIERTLENLLRNAIQAMPDGGDLRVECRREGDEVILAVVDTGVGIEPENVHKLFEPLFTTKATGIGLGLPVCQRYARINGGRIVAGSRPGQGATFQLILPIAAAELSAAAQSG